MDISTLHDIASRIKLCMFTKGLWFPTRKHRGETEKVNQDHKTKKVAKVLVTPCDHPLLEELKTVHSKAYAFLTDAQNTMPTIAKGMYQMRLCRELEITAEMAKFKAQHDVIVPQFLAIYPQLKADAPTKNNGLHDEGMWPTPENVTKEFEFGFTMMGCPTDPSWISFVEANAVLAQQQLREEIQKALKRAADRLSSDGALYQSVFSNLKELLDLVPDFNVIGDATLTAMCQQAQGIAHQSKDTVVQNPAQRKALAAEANRLCSMFGGLATPSAPVVEEPVAAELSFGQAS